MVTCSYRPPRRAAVAALLIVFGCLAATAAAQPVRPAGCNCNSVTLTVVPWCGADGEWYQNGCLGFCAGVAPGGDKCDGTQMPFTSYMPGPSGAESSGQVTAITPDVINAFIQEGLRYVGRIRLARTLGPLPEDFNSTAAAATVPSAANGQWEVPAVRCTSNGDVYVGRVKVPVRPVAWDAVAPGPASMGIAWVKEVTQGAALQPKPSAGLPSLPKLPPLPQLPQLPQLRPPVPLPAPPALPKFDITKPFVSLFRIGESVFDAIFHPGQQKAPAQQQQQQRKTATSKTATKKVSSVSSPIAVRASPPPTQQQQQPVPVPSPSASTKVDLDVVQAFATDSGGARRLTTTPNHQRSLQEIIGTDDRQICPQRSFPWSAIGQIQVTDQSGLFICTGTLIRPDKVLTAAHCVWNTARNAFYQNLNFAPGRYNQNGQVINPWGVVPWRSVTILDSFKRNPSTWDVAVVTLQRPLGTTAGFMGMAAGCTSNTVLTVAGYPQDRASGTCMSSTCRKASIACDAPTNSHTCDTVSGMSGSPMWDNRNRIRMIHVAGVEGQAENRATTLTQFLVNAIAGW